MKRSPEMASGKSGLGLGLCSFPLGVKMLAVRRAHRAIRHLHGLFVRRSRELGLAEAGVGTADAMSAPISGEIQ